VWLLGGTSQNSLATSSIDWNTDSLYLGVTIRGTAALPVYDNEMTPRKQITAVAYAFNADEIDGIHATSTAAVANYLLSLDSLGNLNLYSGGVSSTRATTSEFVLIGNDGGITNLDRSGGDLYVQGGLEVDGTSYFQRTTSTQATTTDYLWIGPWTSSNTSLDLQNGDLYVNDNAFISGRATTSNGLYVGNGALTLGASVPSHSLFDLSTNSRSP